MKDMNADEKEPMQRHVAYWTSLLDKGTAIVFGPVFDPKGPYGVLVENEEHVKQIIDNDPANKLNTYEFYAMRAIFKQN
jgi:uncharacterized protein